MLSPCMFGRTLVVSVVMSWLLVVSDVSAQTQQMSAARLTESSIDHYIRPGMSAFAARTRQLQDAMAELCASPGAATLSRGRAAFSDSVMAWMRIEFLRFGSLTEQNRADRVLFWPDPRGVTVRQVQKLLASEDPGALDPERLPEKSVALQGLLALEYLLYGSGADELAAQGSDGDYRCAFAQAIAGNLQTIAAALETQWQASDDIAHRLQNPGPDNPTYQNPSEALAEIIKSVNAGLQMLAAEKWAPAMERPRRALFRRSELTVAAMQAQLLGVRDLLESLSRDEKLNKRAAGALRSAFFELGNAGEVLQEQAGVFPESVGDQQARGKLEYGLVVVEGLQVLVREELAPAVGVNLGFNAFDGD